MGANQEFKEQANNQKMNLVHITVINAIKNRRNNAASTNCRKCLGDLHDATILHHVKGQTCRVSRIVQPCSNNIDSQH